MAGSLITMILVLCVFVQRFLVEGIVMIGMRE